jgi:actin-like ATPase involved in cell morphogenesis
MAYGLGIDVGTTFTGAALAHETHLEMLPLGDTALVAPSVVFAARDGRLLTGEAAVRLAEAEPGRAVHEFKRRLGDPTPIVLGGQRYSPMELIAAVVRDVVARASAVTGELPQAVVLTCPAIWGPYRLEQFTEVPALSGLDDCRVVTEPEAAAAFYLSGTSYPTPYQLAVVYDLGGGTFDTAVIRATGDHVEMVGHAEGVDGTGGADFDQVVLAMVDEQLDGGVGRLARAQPAQAALLARLRADAVRAKEALSSESMVAMPFFLQDGPHEVRLSRAEFERRIGPILDPTVEAVWRAVASAGVEPAALDAILLSGGSSRVPLVTRRLEEQFARPVRTFGHPKHVVALGAAALAQDVVRARAHGAVLGDDDETDEPTSAGRGSRRLSARRTAVAASLAVLTLACLVTVGIWLGADRSASPTSAPLGDSTSTPTGQPASPATASPQGSSSATAGPPNATQCVPAGPQVWEAGHLGVSSYGGGGTDPIRQVTVGGQSMWIIGQSHQLSRWSNRGRGYIRIGHAYLAMEVDGDLALYRSPQHLAAGPDCAAWRTGTSGYPGAYLRFQPDGNLVLYTSDGQTLWASNTCCDPAADTFAVQEDGTLVIFNFSSERVYWSSAAAVD